MIATGAAVAAVVAVVGAVNGPAAPASTPYVVADRSGSAGLNLHPCRLTGLEHDALCGVLRRPLDPGSAGGTQIDLHVAVLPALARQKLPDPVFFFAGGPGQSDIGLAGTIAGLLARLGARRDLVLIDQRGTGHSAPLQCDTPTPAEGLARLLDRARLVAAMATCSAALQKLPWGDLRFYTTPIAMADADAVRAALGADRIDLVGISYGTRAVLEYLREYPAHVRRAVMDGVAPPDMALPASVDLDGRAALESMMRDCAAAPDCARAHPGLRQTWRRLLASLPRDFDANDPVTGRPHRLTLTSDAVQGLLRPALYTPALGALLPYAIEAAAAGNVDVLLALGSSPVGSPSDLSEGEHFAVVCSEDMPRLPPLDRNGDGDRSERADEHGAVGLYREVCAHWPRGVVPAAFYTIPPSPAPVLLLSGGLDPVTPPRHAERVARALGAQARAVIVANGGHGVTSLACLRDALFHFIDAASDASALAVDASCAANVPRPLAFQAPLPARAAPAANDPDGFGDAPRLPPQRAKAAP